MAGSMSRILYGHFSSKTPFPQQVQLIKPSGEAPRWGYNGSIWSPVEATVNESWWSFTSQQYASLATDSLPIPHLIASVITCCLHRIDFTRDCDGESKFVWQIDPNFEAVSRPTRCSCHTNDSDCNFVDSQRYSVSSLVIFMPHLKIDIHSFWSSLGERSLYFGLKRDAIVAGRRRSGLVLLSLCWNAAVRIEEEGSNVLSPLRNIRFSS